MNEEKKLVAILIAFAVESREQLYINEPSDLVPKTVAENPSLPAIVLNGTTLHAETQGNPANLMVIFLHGGLVQITGAH